MSYKSIVVQLDASARAHPRLEYALRLATQFDAHLTGVFSAFAPDPRTFYVMAGTADYYEEHRKVLQERHGALERIFHAELLRAGVTRASGSTTLTTRAKRSLAMRVTRIWSWRGRTIQTIRKHLSPIISLKRSS